MSKREQVFAKIISIVSILYGDYARRFTPERFEKLVNTYCSEAIETDLRAYAKMTTGDIIADFRLWMTGI